MDSETLAEIYVCEHSSVRYLQMQVNEAVSCKDKAICEHNPETA